MIKDAEIVNADCAANMALAWTKVSKTGSNLTDLATRQHAGLSDVTSDQHHAQAHHAAHESGGADAIAVALADAAIPNLSANKITTDTLALARIPTMDTDYIPSLDAGKITTGVLDAARVPAPTGIPAGIEAERPEGSASVNIYWATDTKKLWAYDGSEWQDCKPTSAVATVSDFQVNAGTGTATNPANLNNNDPATAAVFDTAGEYVEIDFGKTVMISAYRYYGYDSHAGDGLYMLQYWDGSAWVNHFFDIPTRAGSWSAYVPFAAVKTTKVRVVAVALDTYDNSNHAHEWEIVGNTYRELTVADFQANPATGTMSMPSSVNDNTTTTTATATPVGEYVEIDFGSIFHVGEYRFYGYASQSGDGTFKLQHWDGEQWVDNTVDIPTRGASWSDWIPLTTPVTTSKVRIVSTLLDTGSDNCLISEWEMRG